MKKKNNLLLMMICLLSLELVFIACDDDDDDAKHDTVTGATYPEYIGKVNVDNGYQQDEVVSIFKSLGDNTYDISILKVRFSENMPVYVDVELKNLPATIEREDTLIHMDTLVPYAMNGYMAHYTFYNFNCKVNKDSMIFWTDSSGFKIDYKAKRKNNIHCIYNSHIN